jgi:hypothetical protein
MLDAIDEINEDRNGDQQQPEVGDQKITLHMPGVFLMMSKEMRIPEQLGAARNFRISPPDSSRLSTIIE